MKKAFTMVELIFVIVVIGILAVVAVPKLTPLVDTAQEGKARATLASVRSAVSTERQKQILRGVFDDVNITNDSGRVFSTFGSGDSVLEYDIKDCTNHGCWHYDSVAKQYIYKGSGSDCAFKLTNSRFEIVDKTAVGCTQFLQ